MTGAAILRIGTALPPHRLDQAAASRWLAAAFGNRAAAVSLERLAATSGILHRYSCLPDFLGDPREATSIARSGTAHRMELFARHAPDLAVRAARTALADLAGPPPTHLITASCTGLFAPGLELELTAKLGLPPNIMRINCGFMGCHAALSAIRLAGEIVQGQPEARVLIVAIELCTLHLQPDGSQESLIAATLFGDGAAACLVGRPGKQDRAFFQVRTCHSHLLPDAHSEMIWQVGDHGFALRLSPRIPARLAAAAPTALMSLIGGGPRPRFWAIHPGGRAILDRLGAVFKLSEAELAPSRAVLAQYGNLSSPSILFVLDEWRRRLEGPDATDSSDPVEGVAMAFGPGLVMEMAHLRFHPAAAGAGVTRRAAGAGAQPWWEPPKEGGIHVGG